MKMTTYNSWIATAIIALVGLCSCERNADVELPESESKITITSWITAGDDTLKVLVTRSRPVFDGFQNYIQWVDNAVVSVSDGENTLFLEYNPNAFVYSAPTMGLLMEPGRTYRYSVQVGEKTLTAATSIPIAAAGISSLEASFTPSNGSDFSSYGVANTLCRFRDPDPLVFNYYVVFVQMVDVMEGNSFVTSSTKIFLNDQQMVNGESTVRATLDAYSNFGSEQQLVRVRLLTCSREYYEFHRSAQLSAFSGDNPFSEPVSVFSNVNGGLGAVGGFRETVTEIPFEQ